MPAERLMQSATEPFPISFPATQARTKGNAKLTVSNLAVIRYGGRSVNNRKKNNSTSVRRNTCQQPTVNIHRRPRRNPCNSLPRSIAAAGAATPPFDARAFVWVTGVDTVTGLLTETGLQGDASRLSGIWLQNCYLKWLLDCR